MLQQAHVMEQEELLAGQPCQSLSKDQSKKTRPALRSWGGTEATGTVLEVQVDLV